jgi:hypothetical protein
MSARCGQHLVLLVLLPPTHGGDGLSGDLSLSFSIDDLFKEEKRARVHWRIIISPIYFFVSTRKRGIVGALHTLLLCKQRAAEEISCRGSVESVIDPASPHPQPTSS